MKSRKFILLYTAIIVVHILLILYYGLQKEGFHEDEYYSYFTSAGNLNLYPYDSSLWELRGYDVQRQFLVTDEHRFDFKAISKIQESDVHPPLYYLSLHFLMSLFPNRFYKWFGIGLNTIFSLISCCGVMFFFYCADKSRNRRLLACAAGLTYAIWPSVISSVMFTRMYAMSAMWTVLYADIFILLMTCSQLGRKKFAALTISGGIICYLSFLTHYFCLFMAFFLTLGYCIYTVVRRKGIGRMLIYGVVQVCFIGLAILAYPACLDHIFNGYRGEDTLSGLFDSAPFERLKLFLPIIDKNFFADLFAPSMIIFGLALAIVIFYLAKNRKTHLSSTDTNSWALFICMMAGVLSVWILCRTSLFLGDSSSRYFYPVGAILLPLMSYCICKAGLLIHSEAKASVHKIPGILLASLIAVPAILGTIKGNILFLYPESGEKVRFSQENAQYPVVVIYNREAKHRSWFMANELWPYEHVIYLDYQEEQTIEDSPLLKTAEKLIVYVVGSEDILQRIVAGNEKLHTFTPLRSDTFFAVYVLE